MSSPSVDLTTEANVVNSTQIQKSATATFLGRINTRFHASVLHLFLHAPAACLGDPRSRYPSGSLQRHLCCIKMYHSLAGVSFLLGHLFDAALGITPAPRYYPLVLASCSQVHNFNACEPHASSPLRNSLTASWDTGRPQRNASLPSAQTPRALLPPSSPAHESRRRVPHRAVRSLRGLWVRLHHVEAHARYSI
jgi:hypothetical protein